MVKKVLLKEVKRVDTSLKKKKVPTKSELEVQVKILKQANEALEEKNKKNIEIIQNFEGKILNLENQIDFLSCRDSVASKETQTEAGLNLKCSECNFEAESERELGWHMGRHHGWPSDEKSENMSISLLSTDPRTCDKCEYEAESFYDLDAHTWDDSVECDLCENTFENDCDARRHKNEAHCIDAPQQTENKHEQLLKFSCQFCNKKFVCLRELMIHKKRQHEENIDICWNYATGNCNFGSENCWFSHADRTLTKFGCISCEKIFVSQVELLHHRKKYHIELVQTCKHLVSGECKYGNEKCWFRHGDSKDITEDENDKKVDIEVIEKLFGMMEKFTKQMVEMKEMNNLK